MWLLSRLRARVPDVDVHVRQMAHSPVYGFYLTSSFEVFLQKAEELGLKKKLRTGGITDFKYDERDSFENSDDPTVFFKSGERQSMILEMVNDLRAVEGDELGKIKFVEGQQIGMKICILKKVKSQVKNDQRHLSNILWSNFPTQFQFHFDHLYQSDYSVVEQWEIFLDILTQSVLV